MDLREYTRLKERADSLQREADRAEGAFEQVKTRLADDHGCKSVKAAEKMLAALQKEEDSLAAEYETALASLITDYPQLGDS